MQPLDARNRQEGINSESYWDRRFETDWSTCGGNEQTRLFMEIVLELLPQRVRTAMAVADVGIIDWGCAEGDGVPVLEAAFPEADVVGIDIADTAIERARIRHPGSQFRRSDLFEEPMSADVVVTSNVLEHFADPIDVLERLAQCANDYVVVLVPFLEWPLIDEHEVSLTHESFPLSLPDGKRLLHARSLDVRWRRPSPWPGLQLLVVYGNDIGGGTLADLNQFGPELERRRDRRHAIERVLLPVLRSARNALRNVAHRLGRFPRRTS